MASNTAPDDEAGFEPFLTSKRSGGPSARPSWIPDGYSVERHARGRSSMSAGLFAYWIVLVTGCALWVGSAFAGSSLSRDQKIGSYVVVTGVWLSLVFVGRMARTRHKREGAVVRRLGWSEGSGGLWRHGDASPGGLESFLQTSASHGRWRGRDAESAVFTGQGRFMVVRVARADVLELPGNLPRVVVSSRGKEDHLAEGSFEVLDLDSAEFTGRFRVSTTNVAFAHALLSPAVMERLLREDASGLAMTIAGNRITVWTSPHKGLGDLEGHLSVMADVADLFPADLYEEWRGDRETDSPPT